jgi:hypothetical protein
LLNAIFLLESDVTDIDNTAASASHLELCPDKCTVRVVWEHRLVSK